MYIWTHKQEYIRYIIYTHNIYILNVEQQTTEKNKEKMPLLRGLHGFLQLQAPWIEIFFKKWRSTKASFFQVDWFPMSLKAPPHFSIKGSFFYRNWCSPKISRKFHEITYILCSLDVFHLFLGWWQHGNEYLDFLSPPEPVEAETLMGCLNLQDQEVEIDADGLILV